MHDAQDRPVAPHDHQKIAPLRQVLHVEVRWRQACQRGRGPLGKKIHAVLCEFRGHRPDNRGCGRLFRVREEADHGFKWARYSTFPSRPVIGDVMKPAQRWPEFSMNA